MSRLLAASRSGACPPCPLGTPLLRRNVCVCVLLIPSRGKGSPSAEFLTGPCCCPPGRIRAGASTGAPGPRAALRGVPSLGEELRAEVTGQAGESAPPGFQSHCERLNPRSHRGTLQAPARPPTLRLLARQVGTPPRAVQRCPRGTPCSPSPAQGCLRVFTWPGRHTSPGLWGSLGCLSGSNRVRGRPPPYERPVNGRPGARHRPRSRLLHSPVC